VATGVLHNVGNVLNSVNVSCTLLMDQLRESRVANLAKVADLMAEPEGGLAGFLSGLILGHLADRFAPDKLGRTASLLGSLFMVPHAVARSLAMVFGLRFGVTLCVGGLEPIFQSWVAKSTPREDRGLLFGSIATVRALGWAAAPLLSGLVAAGLGTRSVFLVGGVLFLVMALIIPTLFRRISHSPPTISTPQISG